MSSGAYFMRPSNPEFVMSQLSQIVDWGSLMVGESQGYKGENVKVAILDTGCSLEHPDLKDAIFTFKDMSGGNKTDGDGHGTHVAGIIGARANDTGILGVAPSCQIGVYKVLSDSGWGEYEWFVKAIYAALEDGCQIFNMSLGTNEEPTLAVRNAIEEAKRAGCLMFAASGNDGRGVPESGDAVDFPARWPEVVAVGSVERNKEHSNFSSPGPSVALCAPGRDIYSCWPNTGYAVLTGTSMATPFVTGVAAVYWSYFAQQNGEAKIADLVLDRMQKDAQDLGAPGKDPFYGYGLVSIKI